MNEKETTHSEKEKGEILEENFKHLTPKDTINILGYVSYKESMQSWSIINLRREILTIFPQLKEKRGKFAYSMYYNRSPKELKKIVEDLEKKEVTPILLLLGRVKEGS